MMSAKTCWIPLLAGILLGCLAPSPGFCQSVLAAPGGIVAVVGDDVITQTEMDKEVDISRSILLRRGASARADQELVWLQRAVLERMIDQKILLQLVRKEEAKTKDQGPYISEPQVDKEIEEQAKAMGPPIRGPEDVYDQVREESGIGREEFRKAVREKLAVNKYLWLKVFGVSDDFVPPQELRAYYQAHLEEFAAPVRVSFRQIKVRLTRDDTTDRLIQMIKEGLKKGEDFVELGKRALEVQGGDPEEALRLWDKSFEELKGWRGPVAETLRVLKKGEASEPVLTGDAFCFFRVEERKEGEPKPFSEVQEQIRKRIIEGRNRSRLEDFLDRQRKKTRIDRFLPPLPEMPTAQARAEKPK